MSEKEKNELQEAPKNETAERRPYEPPKVEGLALTPEAAEALT